VACAAAIYTVVDHELLNKDDTTTQTTSSTRTSTRKSSSATTTTRRRASRRTTYVVKAGDSLSTIASKEGVDVGSLAAANPKVDPAALHPGQKLKLPR
jgi:LysM repeat protein